MVILHIANEHIDAMTNSHLHFFIFNSNRIAIYDFLHCTTFTQISCIHFRIQLNHYTRLADSFYSEAFAKYDRLVGEWSSLVLSRAAQSEFLFYFETIILLSFHHCSTFDVLVVTQCR